MPETSATPTVSRSIAGLGAPTQATQHNTYSDSFDSSPRDLLTVIQLDSLQVVAVLQVFQSYISDKKTVIKLQHLEPLLTTCTVAQMKNPIISDQFTVR